MKMKLKSDRIHLKARKYVLSKKEAIKIRPLIASENSERIIAQLVLMQFKYIIYEFLFSRKIAISCKINYRRNGVWKRTKMFSIFFVRILP